MQKNFEQRVLEIVKRIPSGKVTTYGEIARVCGVKSSARMVGWVLSRNANVELPFHRVVNRSGSLTGKYHFETPSLMKELLIDEGITFNEENVELAKFLWHPESENYI
ncbi:MAG: MGMT family protein [Candidatus Kapabacteria bacterium]|jgi:methylated-DNA-protein-cysteine methyltransferase-like protein|nr:MGMT family protein [Candidatus Kapabacteria bacterium]